MRRLMFAVGILVSLHAMPDMAMAGGMRYLLAEDFKDVETAGWPPGWTVENSDGDDRQWEARSLGGSAGGPCLRYLSGAAPADDWVFTPAVALDAGVTYTLSFKTRVTSDLHPHAIRAWAGGSPDAASMTIPVSGPLSPSHTTATRTTATFTVGSPGVYYIGIHCVSLPSSLAVFIDDVLVGVVENNLQIKLQMDKAFYRSGDSSYTAGENMDCLMTVKNVGPTTVTMNALLTMSYDEDPATVLYYIVEDPHGQALVPHVKREISEPSDEDFRLLGPGETIFKFYDLNQGYYTFSEAGIYTIRAIYRNLHDSPSGDVWQGRLESEPVQIHIAP